MAPPSWIRADDVAAAAAMGRSLRARGRGRRTEGMGVGGRENTWRRVDEGLVAGRLG